MGPYSANEPACYDASLFTGIRFDARSAFGDDLIRIQVNTPETNPDTGEVFISLEYPAGEEWDGIEIPFSTIVAPSWAVGISGPVDPSELISLSFAVRTVEPQVDDGLMVVGEKLLPYDLELDNIRFY